MLRPAIVATVLLALALAGPLAASSGPVAFSAPVTVMPGSGEPSLAIDRAHGFLYASTLATASDKVSFSSDGGATWSTTANVGWNAPLGGNDDHVAVGPDGVVYLVSQYVEPGSVCMSVSQGIAGAFVMTSPAACGPPISPPTSWAPVDRPFLAVAPDDANVVYLFFTQPCCNGQQSVFRSDDHGITFNKIATLSGFFPGGIVAGPNGHVWIADKGVVYRSTNKGASWTFTPILASGGDYGLQHVGIARDAGGKLYTTYAGMTSGATPQIWWSTSTDDGITWSVPQQVAASSTTQIFPTIAAGSAGKVAIAWYEANAAGDPNTISNGAAWHVRVAGTFGAGSDLTWHVNDASPQNHKGVLCTHGFACFAEGKDRDLLDFFTVQLDAQDRANIVYGNDFSTGATQFVRSS